jgi:hypothetical protein
VSVLADVILGLPPCVVLALVFLVPALEASSLLVWRLLVEPLSRYPWSVLW